MVRIVEVGPRDGLQNEAIAIPTASKLCFIERLLRAGLQEIEATSFVSPRWVPQLADAPMLWQMLPKEPGPLFSALVPNPRGLERALAAGVSRIALFTAATDQFTQRNINMTVEQSLQVFAQMVPDFREVRPGGWVRGYVSTAFECPYAGRVPIAQVVAVCVKLVEIGVDELSIGDTIGVAAPREVKELASALQGVLHEQKIAFHFHDTRGTAIANVAQALEMGISAFDASAAGLGGCPYAPGAGGNLATEDLVYFLERSGVRTGIDPLELAMASKPILEALGRTPASKSQLATLAQANVGTDSSQ